MSSSQEEALLDALRTAEERNDPDAIEHAVGRLSVYYSIAKRFDAAVPYWRRGALLLERSTAPNSQELATYFHNMAGLCLLPAGLVAEARVALLKAKEIYLTHVNPDAELIRDVDERLHETEA